MDVICTINMFDKKQKIQYGDTIVKVDIDNFENTLESICETHNINKVYFIGDKNYIKGIISDKWRV